MTTGALLTRLQLAGIAALLLVCALLIGAGTLRSPDISFVFDDGPGGWIAAPSTASTSAIRIDRQDLPVTTFARRFTLGTKPIAAELRLRAMRHVTLFVNEQRVELGRGPEAGDRPDWKRVSRADVADLLVTGENVLRAETTNPSGPALLQLELKASPFALATDPGWSVSTSGAPPTAAVRATDVRSYSEALALPSPLHNLADHRDTLLFLFLASVILALLAERRLPPGAAERAPTVVALGLTLLWGALYLWKWPRIPLVAGFDGIAHLAYVRFLLEQHALPLASDGWSMYHPPLFYTLEALLVALFEPARGTGAERMVLRLLPFLAGLGSVWVTLAAARRFFPRDPVRVAFAVGFAGLVPMNVYMSAYVSNEPMHGFLAGLALLATSVVLLEPGGSLRWAATAGLFLGLALLTKVTSLLLVPVICFFVPAKLLVVDRAGAARALGQTATIGLVALALSGWFYARNWLHFGNPFVLNLDLPGDWSYWQQPGFHTPAYYLRFGEALSRPWFAGFESFWDGIYATLWSDAYVGGRAHLGERHPAWSYGFMSAGLLLALPATFLSVVGFVRCVVASLRGGDLPARALLAFHTCVAFGIGFSVLYMTLRLPFWAQAKAFYGLCALVPLSLVSAEGFGWARNALTASRWRWLRFAFWGWVGALAGVIALGFAD